MALDVSAGGRARQAGRGVLTGWDGVLASLRYWRRPLADADKPNDPGQKHDLKARLGLKGRAASAPAPVPLMSGGVQLPPPDPEPVKADPKRSDATIPPRNENDNTPMPAALPGVERVRVEYINISDGESRVASQKTQRLVLVGSILVVGAIAFFLGRGMAGSAASGESVEARKTEIAEKKKFIEASKPLYERMTGLRDDLEKAVLAIAKADADKTDVLEPAVVAQIDDAIGKVAKYVGDKVALDPAAAVGKSAINGEVAAQVVAFAVKTREILVQAQAVLDEAKAMAPLWIAPSENAAKRNIMIEPTELAYKGTNIPVSKGTMIAEPGPPQPVPVKDAAGLVTGTEFHQMVLLEGAKDPVEVKSTQVAIVDLGPLFTANAKGFKRHSFGRLALSFAALHDALKALDLSKLQVTLDTALQQVGR